MATSSPVSCDHLTRSRSPFRLQQTAAEYVKAESRRQAFPQRTANSTCSSVRREFVARTTTEVEAPLSNETNVEKFHWFKHWWPVQFTYNFDTDRPNRIQLLGEFFAVWKSKNGKWVAMKDLCPHRLAPLSEGRVEADGTLMCSYHGWRFNQCGSCVKIPQADSEKSHQTACNNPRSAAQTYPCKERGGILWIWPTACSGVELEAAMEAPISIPDVYADYMEGRVRDGCLLGFTRILPYDYEVLMENLMDPSHLPFSHHGVDPFLSRETGGPLKMTTVTSETSNANISVDFYTGVLPTSLEVVNRNLVLYRYLPVDPDQSPMTLVLLAAPLEDGKSRIVLDTVPTGALTRNEEPSYLAIVLAKFTVLDHLLRNAIFDGDGVFLNIQDSHVRENGAEEWKPEKYFVTSTADTVLMKFRKWLSTEGEGGPFGPTRAKTRRNISRREVLDRYSQHTLECKECQKALRFVNGLIRAMELCIYGCLAAGAWLIVKATHLGTVSMWQSVAVVAAFAVCYFFEKQLKDKILPLFYFVDYVHADKN